MPCEECLYAENTSWHNCLLAARLCLLKSLPLSACHQCSPIAAGVAAAAAAAVAAAPAPVGQLPACRAQVLPAPYLIHLPTAPRLPRMGHLPLHHQAW